MISTEQPLLQPLQQPSRRRSRRRSREMMTLTATDEFWHPPIQDEPAAVDAEDGTAPSTAAAADDGNCSDTTAAPPDGQCSSSTEMVIPPAHPQLLSDEPASVEDLKGRDHTLDVIGSDRDFLSTAKSQGGGFWLMDFLSPEDSTGPEQGDAGIPDGVSLETDECASSLETDECASSGDDEGLPSDDTASVRVDKPARKGVSFDPAVAVQPIPHCSSLSPAQRQKIFSSSFEVRMNKARNKKEFRHDGWDWRAATEEWEMDLDIATGELIHPAHRQRVLPSAAEGDRAGTGCSLDAYFPVGENPLYRQGQCAAIDDEIGLFEAAHNILNGNPTPV